MTAAIDPDATDANRRAAAAPAPSPSQPSGVGRQGDARATSHARRRSFVLSRSSTDHVRQQAQKAGALDGAREFSLLLGRNRRNTAGHDLAALGNVALQEPHVLVVDLRRIGAGERAGLAAA